MVEVTSTQQLRDIISAVPAALIYFYNDNCSPCIALRPKVIEMAGANFPKLAICLCNALHHPEIASEFGIFASPTLLVFFDGRESIRESKYISLPVLQTSIKRYYDLIFGA